MKTSYLQLGVFFLIGLAFGRLKNTGKDINKNANNHMHSDSKNRCSFLVLLFATGDVSRYV